MSQAPMTLPSVVNPQAVWNYPGPPRRHSVSDTWDVLGPFPIHAREQHFLSPSYPLDLSKEIDYTQHWPSSYADNGEVGWTNATSANGTLAVSFPDIRWDSLRATEGWAALQHHAVLRTTITINPPSMNDRGQVSHLLIDVKQGSFFTVLPSWESHPAERRSAVPKWYASNIYSLSAAPSQVVPLPVAPSMQQPTTYDLFVSGDYEIRLFGDPKYRDTEAPELLVDFSVDVRYAGGSGLGLHKSHDVIPDFVDGWAFGQHLGIGLYSTSGWWDVKSVILSSPIPGNAIEVRLLHEIRLAPTQTRVVPILLTQNAAFTGPEINILIWVTSPGSLSHSIPVKIVLKHTPLWDTTPYKPIIASYLYGTSTPTAFVVVPPKQRSQEDQPPILSLHGAGVEIIQSAEQFVPPRHERSWTIAPTGRTAWGFDWHGPSTQDAWATVAALSGILSRNPQWSPRGFAPDTSVVVVGHSNGGQGTWHVISRYPDRVISAVPAAAYVKSQAYVPLVQSRSAHFIDPALRAILETSLTPDDNDLFLTNLADVPLYVVHGGADENVPVWHSRALVDVLKTWNPNANITFREDPGQPHWYPGIFNNTPVQEFINKTIQDFRTHTAERVLKFTLTVAVPAESGPLHGWRIESLRVPGRLARMTVEIRDSTIFVEARNTHMFSVSRSPDNLFFEGKSDALVIDGQRLAFPAYQSGTAPDTVFFTKKDSTWEHHTELQADRTQISGRMSLILNSRAPLLLVVPDKADASALLAALRLAHALDVYHKLDAAITDAAQATDMLRQGTLPPEQNIVVIGGPQNAFARHCLAHSTTRFHIRDDTLYLRDRPLAGSSSALFLAPHPTSATALVLFISANDEAGLERALRLFPIRTGVTVPDWVILSPDTDAKGAGGVDGAGVWGVNWSWNEGMSSF